MDPQQIKSENEAFAPIPEFVFLLEIPPRLGLRRIQNSRGETPNLFEQLDGLTKVDEVYKSLNENYILRMVGSDRRSVIHRHVMNAMDALVEHHVEKHKQCMLFDDEAAFQKIRAIK